eukprot:NODE_294_length_10530_cov_0.245326.p3 type:complete len:127 gc:universal NODE_294_length_10530_cov_0.245326:3388-3768(+)
MPIYLYGCENYSQEGIDLSENHRINIIKKLQYNYYQMINNYMTISNYQQQRLINFTRQLINLGVDPLRQNYTDKTEIKIDNQIEMDHLWNYQSTLIVHHYSNHHISSFKWPNKKILTTFKIYLNHS